MFHNEYRQIYNSHLLQILDTQKVTNHQIQIIEIKVTIFKATRFRLR